MMDKTFFLSCGELQIPCRLTVPDFGAPTRMVLSVHGLGGSTMDDIQQSIAEEMSMFSSVVLRFDFPTHGESPHDSTFFSVKNCSDSLYTAAQWLREEYPELEDLCIFATGYGAYITLVTLSDLYDLPGRIKLVIQTPSVMMHKTLLSMRHITKATLWAMGSTTFRSKRPLEVTYQFYEELVENSVMAAYPIPMLILHSESNQYIDMEDIQNFHRINERSKLVIVSGTQHRFLEPGAWDMVLDLTRDWFDFEQVLLEDWS